MILRVYESLAVMPPLQCSAINKGGSVRDGRAPLGRARGRRGQARHPLAHPPARQAPGSPGAAGMGKTGSHF